MPPRRRRPARAGARPGELSEELRGALREEAVRLAAIAGPVERGRAVGDVFAALDPELETLAQVRYAAVRQLRRDGWSYQAIADAMGVSKGRVAQIVKDPRRSGRTS
jgi:DNA-directed RNA polymerase specialized sigma24 family protein